MHKDTSAQLHVHRVCDVDNMGTSDYIFEERVVISPYLMHLYLVNTYNNRFGLYRDLPLDVCSDLLTLSGGRLVILAISDTSQTYLYQIKLIRAGAKDLFQPETPY